MISRKTSSQIKNLMRLVVRHGTAKKADVPGYFLGGKTGTADKPGSQRKGYGTGKRISSFVSAFPITDPKYLVFVLVDEPKGTKKTFGFATGGWVAAPIVKRIVTRMVSVIGFEPLKFIEKKNHPSSVFYIRPGPKKGPRSSNIVFKKPTPSQSIVRTQNFSIRPRGQTIETN